MLSFRLKRLLAITFVVVMLVSPVVVTAQQTVTVASQIDIGEDTRNSPQKLSWNDGALWYSNINNETIVKVDPSSGQVTQSINTGIEYPSGIVATNSSVWVVAQSYEGSSTIRQLNPETGKEISRIPAPGDSPSGIAYDGENLWVDAATDSGGTIFEVDPQTGDVLSRLEDASYNNVDLAWGAGFLWLADGSNVLQIDPSTPTAEPVQEFESPYLTPTGVAWDGQYLWETEVANSTISRIDVGQITQPNAAPNASFTYSPQQPASGDQISFDGSSSSDTNGFVETYQWDFDGDEISDSQAPNPSYTYDSPGIYTVNLTVIDDNDVEGTMSKTINVTANEPTQQEASNDVQRTEDEGSAPPQSTPAPTPVSADQSRTSESTTQPVSSTIEQSPGTNTDNEQEQRGFFTSNAEGDPFSFLSNPLALTIAGFIASALGILIQLFGGR